MLHTSLSLLFWWMVLSPAAEAVPVSLAGSAASMERQHAVAVASGYEFLHRPTDVKRALNSGILVPLEPSPALALKYPMESVARPEVGHFLQRFSTAMHTACGERLVVTSSTRPKARQPRNAHRLSVHPAGMATDLRVPASLSCRRWLEAELLELETRGVLDVTRERSPAHYHVALFPEQYLAHLGLDAPPRVEVVAVRSAPRGGEQGPLPYASPR